MQKANRARRNEHPILIVAPTGLLKNWYDEHVKHLEGAGLGELLKAYGSQLREIRRFGAGRDTESKSGAPALRVPELEEADWVLTTYETLRDYAHSFGRVHWAAMVMDEAQKIKNPGALVTEECKAVASNADFVIAMTGTPVENRLADLWSLVDTCEPGHLGSLNEFVHTYDVPEERDRAIVSQSLRELGERLLQDSRGGESEESPSKGPVILRRMKWDELDGLPEKHTHLIRDEMPIEQARAYADVIAAAHNSPGDFSTMLKALHHMRQISLHPEWDSGLSDEDFIARSARVRVAFQMLDEIADKRERVLIFVEFLGFQPILQGILQRRYGLQHPPMIINGTVSGDRRKLLVDRFQEGDGFDAMILSPRAGGLGLTLTSANHVIHLSRWWNPAVEDQCTDRIYRIGQNRPIHVHLPLAIHPQFRDASFDECLNSLLGKKRRLSQEVLGLAAVQESKSDLTELFGGTVKSAAQ